MPRSQSTGGGNLPLYLRTRPDERLLHLVAHYRFDGVAEEQRAEVTIKRGEFWNWPKPGFALSAAFGSKRARATTS